MGVGKGVLVGGGGARAFILPDCGEVPTTPTSNKSRGKGVMSVRGRIRSIRELACPLHPSYYGPPPPPSTSYYDGAKIKLRKLTRGKGGGTRNAHYPNPFPSEILRDSPPIRIRESRSGGQGKASSHMLRIVHEPTPSPGNLDLRVAGTPSTVEQNENP